MNSNVAFSGGDGRNPSWVTGLLVGGLMAVLGAGCNSANRRIEEKASVYAQLAPAVQAGIRRGDVGVGFTPDMTYMALGRPTLVESSADGREVTWTYMSFNTPQGHLVADAPHVISPNLSGAKGYIYGITPRRSGYGGEQVVPIDESGRLPTLADSGNLGPGEAGLGWQSVAGRAELERGELTVANPRIRPKTAMEAVLSSERQDLLVKFVNGQVVGLELVRM